MDKIYEHADDLHVRAIKIYAKAADVYAYSDAAKTLKIDAATLQDLFIKGCVVDAAGILYRPVSFKVASTVGTLTYVTTDGTTATTAVLATLVSSEYVAG
jgi:hypothetical protein